MTQIQMTRRVVFSAALIVPHETNPDSALFGYSGHNYTLDVGVMGKVDPRTGIVVNIKEIDQIVRRAVLEKLDGKLINGETGPIGRCRGTSELVLEKIHEMLEDQLPDSVSLTALRLESTQLDVNEWLSETGAVASRANSRSGETLVTRVYEFAASHRLNSPHLSDHENVELFGKCNHCNGHGHNYVLEVTVSGKIDENTGVVISIEQLDAIVNAEIIDRYDHRHLNMDIPEFFDVIPSSEIVTRTIWDRIEPQLRQNARLYRVILRETARNFFEYYGKD